jgi:hypothetical protein
MGTTVIATTYDAAIDNTTAHDSAPNSDFATPNRNITGENTIMVVTVEASTASATSSLPSRAAAAGDLPSSRCRLMFSSTTIELSTSRPIASANPPRVMMLMVEPLISSPKAAAKIESGIDRKIATVELKLPRKMRITTEASTAPEPASSSRLEIAPRM